MNDYSKRYRAENEEKIKLLCQKHYKNNREKILKRSREYYTANKEHVNKKVRERVKNNPIRSWTNSSIQGHKDRGFVVEMTRKELEYMARITTNCFYCDTALKYRNGKFAKNSATVDRNNNEFNLNLQNIRIICNFCNRTKGERDHKQFIEYCKNIVSNFG